MQMKNIFMFLLFVTSIVLLFGLTFSYSQSEESEGQKIFIANKCGSCHSVESAGLTSKKKDAVDLSSTGDDRTIEFLKKYIAKEEKINDKAHKFTFKGSEEELNSLTEWLESLKTKKQ